MALRYLAIGSLALLTAVAASSAVSTLRLNGPRPNLTSGNARLYVIGSRSAEQRQSVTAGKLDSVLADLSRHASLARPGHVLADLHALSPAARFSQRSADGAPLVLVDANTRGNSQLLANALIELGLERAAVYANDVGGWLPVTQIEAAAARAETLSIRASMPRARTGAVTSQGDFAERSDVVRTNEPTLTGAGITVGVLSDSFNCYSAYAANGVPASGAAGYASNGFTADEAKDLSTGDLPASVNVLEEANCLNYGAPIQLPFGDEGRAMLQVVHDVAPGAGLAFHTAVNSEADFASGIGNLATAGAKVIADDVVYFDEPFFQDGILAQAIDAAEARGVAYFSAAGNDGSLAYENTAPHFSTLSSSGPNAGEFLLNFDTSGATTTTNLPVSVPAIPPGDFLAVVVQWDQPYVTGAAGSPGASSQIDVCITGGTGSDTITDYDGHAVSCTGPNATGIDPYQIMIIGNPANATANSQAQNFNIVVGLADGTAAPGRILIAVEDNGLGSKITSFATNSATLQGHAGAAGAAAVGAAFYFTTPRCGTTPAKLELFSSQGGAPILFDAAGTRLATPVVRQKPDFVGPDGGNDTFLGFTLASAGVTNGLLTTSISECQNNPSYPNFFGTSAATPHAASIAALLLQANAAATPTQIYAALRASALPMSGTTPNFNSGYGFLQADAALAQMVPGAPDLTLAATSVVVGSSTTITWSSVNATSCAASGGWSGALATSGTQTLSPTVAGTSTYSLTCANSAGASNAGSVTLTATTSVATAMSQGGGGGALGEDTLFGLAVLALARMVRARARVTHATSSSPRTRK
jgi:Subtilase family